MHRPKNFKKLKIEFLVRKISKILNFVEIHRISIKFKISNIFLTRISIFNFLKFLGWFTNCTPLNYYFPKRLFRKICADIRGRPRTSADGVFPKVWYLSSIGHKALWREPYGQWQPISTNIRGYPRIFFWKVVLDRFFNIVNLFIKFIIFILKLI